MVGGRVVATGRITGPSAGLVAGGTVLVEEEGAVGTVLGGFVLTVEVVPTDVTVKTVVVVGSGDVVDDDVDDVPSGRVDSNRLVVVSRMDVVELVVDDGSKLLVGGNEVGNSVEGGTVLVVVSGVVVVVVGHGSTILVVVS